MIRLLSLPLFLLFSSIGWYTEPPKHALLPPSYSFTGKQPALFSHASGRIGLVYGRNDSLFYTASTDKGNTFSPPQLIARLPDAMIVASRGPQLTATADYTIVTVATTEGSIYAYRLDHASGKWAPGIPINDADTTAKEGFVAVASTPDHHVLAAWLDIRNTEKGQKLYGALSTDGGITWGKNRLLYQSPEGSICQCCKLSVVAGPKDAFHVMFRNWLKGSRDLYLISSLDGGQTFGKAQKLGKGTWPLEGCPMDGGDLAVDGKGAVWTVWRRQKDLFLAQPGNEEKHLGSGRTPSIAPAKGGNFIAWQQGEDIVVTTPAQATPRVVGKGAYPQIRALPGENAAWCTWEEDGQVRLQRVK